jgi:S-adenosylmethionine-diacylglycerol 3-amino-3-carboxypropyl transferase
VNFLFKYFIKDQIIFNTSWEDPAIDRKLLEINHESNILTITSAGDNVLDYLLDTPNSVTSIDLNPSQNALAELKLAVIKHSNYETLFDMFGYGKFGDIDQLLAELKPSLSEQAYSFWIKKKHYFTSKLPFYHYGTSGLIARGFYYHLKLSKKLRQKVDEMVNCTTLDEQAVLYVELEKILFDNFTAKFLLQNRFTLSFLGIPEPQARLLNEFNDYGNMYDFILGSLRTVFKEYPLSQNYFWYLYIRGQYSKVTCPNYLKENNFDLLKQNVGKVGLKTDTFFNHLKNSPSNCYSHIVLLDHFDWFWQDKETQLRVWNEIKRVASPDAKLLFRSAASNRKFLIPEIQNEVEYRDELTGSFTDRGRVGTYGSVNYGIIRKQ